MRGVLSTSVWRPWHQPMPPRVMTRFFLSHSYKLSFAERPNTTTYTRMSMTMTTRCRDRSTSYADTYKTASFYTLSKPYYFIKIDVQSLKVCSDAVGCTIRNQFCDVREQSQEASQFSSVFAKAALEAVVLHIRCYSMYVFIRKDGASIATPEPNIIDVIIMYASR